MKTGKKIRQFRTEKGLSQKELARMSGLSEPAIRNYELGNRTPSEKQLSAIAEALEISPFAISEPNIESHIGVMYTLFALEDEHDAIIISEPGATYLTFKNTSSMYERMTDWGEIYQKYRSGEISEEEYKEWKATYPEGVIHNINKLY